MGNLSFLGWPRLGNSRVSWLYIPIELAKLNRLKCISFSFNDFIGEIIPPWFGSFTNNFTGSIPQSQGYIAKLEAMDLSANNLKELCMASNQLSGVTPPSIVNMYTMVQILGLNDHWHETIKDPRTHDQLWLGASFFKWTTGMLCITIKL